MDHGFMDAFHEDLLWKTMILIMWEVPEIGVPPDHPSHLITLVLKPLATWGSPMTSETSIYTYIYICVYICHICSYSFPQFSPTCFPNFPHIISPYHHIMARSPGAAQGDPRAHQGRVFRQLQRVALQQSGGPGDGDGDLLWLVLRETMMWYIYIYTYVSLFVFYLHRSKKM